MLFAAIGGAVVVVLLVLFLLRRRGGDTPPEDLPQLLPVPKGPEGTSQVAPPAPQIVSREPLGAITAVQGPRTGESFAVSSMPLSVGSGLRCSVQLPEAIDEMGELEVAAEHARVWVRDGHLMVHEMRRLTAYGAAGGRWEILSNGEMFDVGQTVFRFDLQPAASGQKDASATTPPQTAEDGAEVAAPGKDLPLQPVAEASISTDVRPNRQIDIPQGPPADDDRSVAGPFAPEPPLPVAGPFATQPDGEPRLPAQPERTGAFAWPDRPANGSSTPVPEQGQREQDTIEPAAAPAEHPADAIWREGSVYGPRNDTELSPRE
jgi:hypothetical protein